MSSIDWVADEEEDRYEYVCKPSYFAVLDPFEAGRVDKLAEEVLDVFSPAQLAQFDMWQKNEKARRREACLRRRYGDLRPMTTGEFDYKRDGYSLAKLFNKRDSLLNEVYDSKKIASKLNDHVNAITPALVPMLSTRLNADSGVIEQSVRALFSAMGEAYPGLTAIRRLLWILAANAVKVQAGEVVTLFDRPLEKEWAPVLLTEYIRRPDKPDRCLYEFFILGGSGATCSFRQEISFSQASYSYLVGHMFRIRRKGKRVEHQGRAAFVGMRTWALLEPVGRKMFNSAACCDIFKKENRDVYDSRQQPCPYDYDDAPEPKTNRATGCMCEDCPMGLEDCKYAFHKRTYTVGVCSVCGRSNAWLPSRFSTVCTACQKRSGNAAVAS